MHRCQVSTRCGWAAGLLVCLASTSNWGAEPFETLRDIVYAQRGQTRLQADVYQPAGDGPFPGVLLVHGGAWAIGSRSQMGAIGSVLATRGYTAVSIDYRLAPQFEFPAQIDDCRAALQWMERRSAAYKIDPQRIGAWGYSAGGQLVALLGTTNPPKDAADPSVSLRAVVAGGAPCDFTTRPLDSENLVFWLGGTRRQEPQRYLDASPARHVAAGDPPMFFYNGQHDQLVPPAEAAAMVKSLQAVGVDAEQYVSPGREHILAFLERRPIEKGVDFLDRHLKPATPPAAVKP